jgi:hypothetical protein
VRGNIAGCKKNLMDPEGYYALLGVPPTAGAATIAAAFRAKARLLHPDIPVTGNAASFIRLREAYDVLGNELRRARYDRQARATPPDRPPSPPVPRPNELPPLPDLPELPVSQRALRIGLTAALIAMAAVSVVELAIHVAGLVAPPPASSPRAAPAGEQRAEAPLVPIGTPTHYVLPAGGPAPLWRFDRAHNGYMPAGRLPPFTGVALLNTPPRDGMVEVRVSDGHGYIDATRLAPGGADAARNAYCSYNAGPPLMPGEVLVRRDGGPATLRIDNNGGDPLVLKLRDATGTTALSVAGSYTVEYASGTLWSRACGSFVAGERSWQIANLVQLAGTATIALPAPDATEMSPDRFADK